ncbi:hypothetical protein LF1_04090 [Rubripirellula obstinata]|uniref:Secreted protein n=1 Tax=Rubripirellula obstinata TaxID=406547 RepID=A0A5B1CDR8_9BACT|nr:hypothetical protein [Rubripirellula obstinata]KAA1257919.1 hypothetical protein LF1_04090 [Rubripirellula obstinata]
MKVTFLAIGGLLLSSFLVAGCSSSDTSVPEAGAPAPAVMGEELSEAEKEAKAKAIADEMSR